MKNFYKKITAFICLVLLVFSMSGCSLILDVDGDTNPQSNLYSEISFDVELSKQLIFCDTGTNDTPTIEKAEFISNVVDNDFTSFSDAADEVKRSVVKIIMMDAKGNHLSYGSAVIVDIAGGLTWGGYDAETKKFYYEYYVLTCNHVVSNGGGITLCVPDANGRNHGDWDYDESYMFSGYIGGDKQVNSSLAVSLVGGDRDADIAVLKLRTSYNNLQKATFLETNNLLINELEYAQDVFSIGNPTGTLPMTFLSGNISYLDRLVVLDSIGYMELIQHDCLITHGSSGGGLFNMKGQLIGITNAGSDVYKGMNYAIPYYGIDGFVSVANSLIKTSTPTNYGYVDGRWNLGITITEKDSTVKGSSVSIVSVDANSDSYGLLKRSDYITKVEFSAGGKTYSYNITSANEFKNAIFIAREGLVLGDTIKITVARQESQSIA